MKTPSNNPSASLPLSAYKILSLLSRLPYECLVSHLDTMKVIKAYESSMVSYLC